MRDKLCGNRWIWLARLAFGLWLLSMAWLIQAAESAPAANVANNGLARIPPALHGWIPWVTPTAADWRCPVRYNEPQRRHCLWPTALSLELDQQGGHFSQQSHNDAEGWLILPGDRRYWPQEVQLDGQPVPVLEREQRPAVKTPEGEHRLTGRFFWSELPEALRIPPNAGLLDLMLEGESVALPRLEGEGVLWLRQRPSATAEQDQLELQVFRLLTDRIPFTVATRLELRVSGQAREEWLGPVLPPDFWPLALDSPLPARLEPDGRLRVQLTPGHWIITIQARHHGPVERLALPTVAEPWPVQEIWSFQAQNQLRVVQVEGAPALDPSQTNLPPEWRTWPAYLVQAGGELRFITRQRGEAAAPERLRLERALWLDFAGNGYTVQDRLRGDLAAVRLEAEPELHLGRVAINGEDQFITNRPGTRRSGVEVRQMRDLDLTADSRLEPPAIRNLPAVGWNITPQGIDAALHLPPGWRLLAASGPDQARGAWLPAWNLLDLFLVLVIALAFGRLWDWRWGLVALAGMALSLQEPNAPIYVWLNVLAAIGLLRVLSLGRLRRVVQVYYWLALLSLLALGAWFALQQVRGVLHPQLEARQSFSVIRHLEAASTEVVQDAWQPPVPSSRAPYSAPPDAEAMAKQKLRSNLQQQQYAANLKVQTGPGLPDWSWRDVNLSWSGPVTPDERLQLWLLPPWATRLLTLLGLALLAAMAARVFAWRQRRSAAPPTAAATETSAALPLLLLGGLLLAAAPLHAQEPKGDRPPEAGKVVRSATEIPSPASPPSGGSESATTIQPETVSAPVPKSSAGAGTFPSAALLEELRQRLSAPPDCPRCADLAALELTAQGDELQLRLMLQAQTTAAVPLPLPRTGLIVRSVSLDDQPALLFRDSQQGLWLRLPAGIHEARIAAAAPETLTTLQLPLPMTPGRVTLHLEGWQVEGYAEGRVDQQLQLTRQRETAAPLQAGVVPPFLEVARELILDVDWRVETRVRRLSQADAAAVVEIPLLPGERVTTSGVRVREGRVLLNLPPDQVETGWSAALSQNDSLILRAAEQPNLLEVWRLRAGPLWHVEAESLPVVQRLDEAGQWSPEWRPWPGEILSLRLQRPEGAPGEIVTVDQSRLQLQPGRRQTEAVFEWTARASRGAERILTLPPGATLTGAWLDEVVQPLQQRGQQVTVPLAPGVQKARLTWREERGLEGRYRTAPVELGGPSVNARLSLRLPQDRWLLWASGPVLGPAVLFWGVLLVLLAGAAVLARFGATPLRTHDWFLLGVGLSQSQILGVLLVAAWLVLLARRGRWATRTEQTEVINPLGFNLSQLALAILTLAALSILLAGVQQGLLGPPAMQVAGNGSSAYQLEWYQDRSAGALPVAEVISAPLWLYRSLMLAWSLWLAYAVLRWLRWGWGCFGAGGLWRSLPRAPAKPSASDGP